MVSGVCQRDSWAFRVIHGVPKGLSGDLGHLKAFQEVLCAFQGVAEAFQLVSVAF